VLLAQADRGCHAALSRSIALRVVIIFRMTATMMTLDFLSAVAGFGGEADDSNEVLLGDDTSQQSFLSTPQA